MDNSETHSVCNKHNIGGQSACCECSGKTDCSTAPHQNEWEQQENEYFWQLLHNWRTAKTPEIQAELVTDIESLLAQTEADTRRAVIEEMASIVSVMGKSGDGFSQWAPDRNAEGYDEAIEDVMTAIAKLNHEN